MYPFDSYFFFKSIFVAQFSTKKDHDWTVIRWHQTADFGYVPNEKMPNTFMGVAPDTYSIKLNDFSGGIHPMDKQTPSLRLAIAGKDCKESINETY